ncbi:TonB-dependent receptor [Fodinibius sediminis]|uniref:Carboxypeptidase regulatory-like domain-containing protein n=1 Tax=Fodinibius sediminis TaxID=1214077 RepID=A0A521AFI8_9BACT|nr:carboxypeptidase regulatory-like domain-containing protein [Fodinibius sediminis]SMO33585.1 Carboxypeptidase regulatory-like domain-containing protein [Fodinibius sediminis]
MKRYIFLLAALFLPAVMFAQGTTSGAIQGTVSDAAGASLPGANVVAIHQPTGTRYGTASRSDGRFTIKNVRVGGPYEIQVTFVGFNPEKKEISDVELGETVEVNFALEEGALTLDEISVTAEADRVFNADRTGASTNISQEEIESTPTLSRSLSDFTRLNPQVTSGNSFGGANDRYNNILVDGATLNDVFGLGEGTPGSQAGVNSPISIDAIQEFNVDIAPFDVTNNGFTGGQVNAITRSGTNEYSGSAYYQLRNESFVGNYVDDAGNESSDYASFDEQYFGLRLGGPIVEDKLFFFTNVELKRRSSPLTTGILGSGAPNTFDFPGSTFQEIQDIAANQYGYNPGSFGGTLSPAQDNNKVLAKLDWNINQDHKFSLRYNYVDATDEEGISRGSSSYSYTNRQYNFNSTQHSYVAELNSSFGNNASNTLRAVYTRIRDSRDVVAQPFPEVEISLPFPEKDDYGSFFMGIDRFSQANALDQDLIEVTDNFTYIRGDHEFTLGTSNQFFTFDNTFVQDAYGSYVFRSIDDFREGNPYQYRYSYLLPGGSPTANFNGIQLGFYGQDKWTFTNNLTLTFGIRFDVPILPDEPTSNPQVESSFPGYSTTRVASGNVLVSPRFGFNWDASGGDRTTQIRGGWGIFSGNPPFVWISNQYSNTGADYGRVDLRYFETDAFGEGFFSPDPNAQPSPLDSGSSLEGISTTEVNLLEEDFQYPQSLKFNLAVDQELPLGIIGTLEGVYSKMMNEVKFRNINLEQMGTSIYGRPIYGDIYFSERYGNTSGSPNRVDGEHFTNAIVLDNTSKGYQYSITGELEKQFDVGLRASIAYTYNRAETINNGTSSRAISNWQYNENVDVNNPQLGTADFERRHRILGQLSYRFAYADHFATTLSLIYDGRSGAPFSWIYSGDANGDGRYDNDLIYVPASRDEVVLADDNWNEFNQWIENNESLSDYRGEHVERGTAREPWSGYLDLRINQEINTFSGQNLELTASLFNVLNFLNDEWGVRKSVDGYNNYQALRFQGYQEGTGLPKMDFDPQNVSDEELYYTNDLGSRWQLQLGVRYNF